MSEHGDGERERADGQRRVAAEVAAERGRSAVRVVVELEGVAALHNCQKSSLGVQF